MKATLTAVTVLAALGGCCTHDDNPRPAKIIVAPTTSETGTLFQTADGQRFQAHGYWGEADEIIQVRPTMLEGMPRCLDGMEHWRSPSPPLQWHETPTNMDDYVRKAVEAMLQEAVEKQ